MAEDVSKKDNEKWYYGPIFVVAMLFLVLGPLALPLLWKSPKFNLVFKIILTILVAFWTYLLIKSIFAIWSQVMENYNNIIINR